MPPGSCDNQVRPQFAQLHTASAYRPRRPAAFRPGRIVLARGSRTTAARRRLTDAICRLYPEAQRIDAPDTPHNRVPVPGRTELDRHYRGKRTLVLGAHGSAVRLSQERNNACPNYWHFSPYGFCPYDCTYCYLAGTRGVSFCPAVKVFLNLDEMLARVDRIANRLARPTAFYLGKLQDGLALDPLTGYSRVMVPFFAAHPFARLVLLTKAADVDNLLGLDHQGRTILSWSLSPPEVWTVFEAGTPDPRHRIGAMKRCAQAGYPVRAVIMPVIPAGDWRAVYGRFIRRLLREVPLDRITLGGICSFGPARRLTEAKLGRDNPISAAMDEAPGRSPDGRHRYAASTRIEIYRHLIAVIHSCRPTLPVGLCLEEPEVFGALDMQASIGICNCIL